LFAGVAALGVAAAMSLKPMLAGMLVGLEDQADDGSTSAGPRGRLSLDSSPPATVFLGQRSLGPTPLVEVELPAGPQQLRLVNESEALDQTLGAEITAGRTLFLRPRFPEGTVDLPITTGHRYRVLYKATLVGEVPGPAIELVAGAHDLTLVDTQTNQSETRHVMVLAHAP
jgi:hypothetical protein